MLASKAHANSKRAGGASVDMIGEAAGKLEGCVMGLVNSCNADVSGMPLPVSEDAKLSAYVSMKADVIIESIEEMLKVKDYGSRFFACADEIYYSAEDIGKECDVHDQRIHKDVLQEFIDIKQDLDESVQSLMGLVDAVENSGRSGRVGKGIEKDAYGVAKFIKELLSFLEDEGL